MKPHFETTSVDLGQRDVLFRQCSLR